MGAYSRCLGACRLLHAGRVPLSPSRFDSSVVTASAVVAKLDRDVREEWDRSGGRVFEIGGGSFVGRLPFRSCYSVEPLGGRGLRRLDGSLLGTAPERIRSSNELKRYALFSTSAGEVASKGLVSGTKKEVQIDKPRKEPTDDQIADTQILWTLMRNLWQKDNFEFRLRVMVALSLLVGAKVLNVQVPFLFKIAVDWLTAITGSAGSLSSFNESNSMALALFVSPVAVLIGYGIARMGASACNELRNAVFSKVSLRAIRTVSRKVFAHLHDLDLRYHLSRQTGALNRIIDRGSRAINFILSSMVFNVVPTILEIAMVSGILSYKFGATFAWITSLSVAAYVAFTLVVTQWRTRFRQAMNKADNDAGTRAIDSLLNYETVKYFNNESFEVAKYDSYLKKYEDSALKTQSSLAFLNFGQNVIFSTALSAAMVLSSYGIMSGGMTVGDLVENSAFALRP